MLKQFPPAIIKRIESEGKAVLDKHGKEKDTWKVPRELFCELLKYETGNGFSAIVYRGKYIVGS